LDSPRCPVYRTQLPGPVAESSDNQFNLATLTSALVTIAAAVLLAPSFGAVGIAWSAVIAQLYTLIAYSILAWRAGFNPLRPYYLYCAR
jgi:O-antigen/teichoic acid export membrane protein